MTKRYKIENLCCANCAAKIEDDINKLPGVNKATISFMTQRFTLSADETQLDSILDECDRLVKKHEPDAFIVR